MAEYDAIVLGAGGAGLMCAGVAGQLGARVLVLDHAAKAGKKILISGGGRCNFTNTGAGPGNFLSENPHFAKSALSRYTPQDFVALVDRYRIDWHEKTLGQLFCDGSARQIVAMLLAECKTGGVTVQLDTAIGEVTHADGRFRVAGHVAPSLVIATGGLSIPKMGATGIAYDIARRFGLDVVAPRPALVPLTLAADDPLLEGLAGVATSVRAAADGASFREAALITHRGLSGPAILQVSSYWRQGGEIALDLLPDLAPGWLVKAKKTAPRSGVKAVLGLHLPGRLADRLAGLVGVPGNLGDAKDKDLVAVEARLRDWRLRPTGSEGYAKAEVTAGGISTAALSSKTMEAKALPGLFAIGEAVDVTGWLGGYNFQWAWASGHAAGIEIASRRWG